MCSAALISEAEFMNVQFRWGFLALSWEFSDLRFLHGFIKPYGKGHVFLSGFPPFSFTAYSNWTVEPVKGCVSLKKYKSQGKAVEVTVNRKEENSEDFCLDFVQEFGLNSTLLISPLPPTLWLSIWSFLRKRRVGFCFEEKIYCMTLALCMWTDSEPTKLIDLPKTENLGEVGASDKFTAAAKSFCRWFLRRRDFELPSMSLILLRSLSPL